MHIHTQKAKIKKKLKNFSRGCTTPPKVPKLGVSGVKDTAKTIKDLSLSCYIQVEYSVIFRWYLSFNHAKIIFKNIFFKIQKKKLFYTSFNCVYAHISNLNYKNILI